MVGEHGYRFGRGIGGERRVRLGGAARKDVEGRVDGDFEVAAFIGIHGVGAGEAEDDLERRGY